MSVIGERSHILREYFRSLPHKRREQFMLQLERYALNKGLDSETEEIIDILRQIAREHKEQYKRAPSPSRLFFEPLSPFVGDISYVNKRVGYIPRKYLSSIWNWMKRDVASEKIQMLEKMCASAHTDKEKKAIHNHIAGLRQEFLVATRKLFELMEISPYRVHKQIVQIGGDRGIEELKEIFLIVQSQSEVEHFLRFLQQKMTTDIPEEIGKHFKITKRKHPELLGIFFALFARKFERPGKLVELIVALEGIDDADQLAYSASAPGIEALIQISSDIVKDMKATDDSRDTLEHQLMLLARYHDIVRSLTSHLNIQPKSRWYKQVNEIRAGMSKILENRIKDTYFVILNFSANVYDRKNVLRLRALQDKAIYRLEVLSFVRMIKDSLALNLTVFKVWNDIDPLIDKIIEASFDHLKDTSKETLDLDRFRIDSAIKLATFIYGPDFIKSMQKAKRGMIAKFHEKENNYSAAM